MAMHSMRQFICLVVFILLSIERIHAHMGCGTPDPSHEVLGLDQARIQRLIKGKNKKRGEDSSGHRQAQSSIGATCDELCSQCIEIEVYFHFLAVPVVDEFGEDAGYVLPHPTLVAVDPDADFSEYTTIAQMRTLLSNQMEILNTAYEGTPFRFTHVNALDPKVLVNLQYTNYAYDYREEILEQIRQGDMKTLNIVLAFAVDSEEESLTTGSTIAFATFPSYQKLTRDGIFQRYDSIAGGGLPGSDSGYTLVHEIGHWLGLYHTFQKSFDNFLLDLYGDACSPSNYNDFIDDTPTMAAPTSETTENCLVFVNDEDKIPDTCSELPGDDPVYNYMNYVDNEQCLLEDRGEFTCGQIERMNLQWILYRDNVDGDRCPSSSDVLLEIFIVFDKEWHMDENDFYLTDDSGNFIFDSVSDFEELGVATFQDSLAIDICVQPATYFFTYTDEYGDGLPRGSYFEVFLNGISYARVEGDFGTESVVKIEAFAEESPASTESPTRAPVETSSPTQSPTEPPITSSPTKSPSQPPVTSSPTSSPTRSPVKTLLPTKSPSESPVTSSPTRSPTRSPVETLPPTISPTQPPVTYSPTSVPTRSPIKTSSPTTPPTVRQTARAVTIAPTALPTKLATTTIPTPNTPVLTTTAPTVVQTLKPTTAETPDTTATTRISITEAPTRIPSLSTADLPSFSNGTSPTIQPILTIQPSTLIAGVNIIETTAPPVLPRTIARSTSASPQYQIFGAVYSLITAILLLAAF